MITVETIGRVRHAFLVKGKGIKEIARELRSSRNTVRVIVRGEETEHRYVRRAQSLPQLGAHAARLDTLLDENAAKPARDCCARQQRQPYFASTYIGQTGLGKIACRRVGADSMDIYEEIRSLLGKLAETSSIVSAVAALAGVAFSLISAWFMTSRDIPRKSEESQNQLSIQIAHIKSYLEKQHFQERVNRYSSDMLNISQYVVGAALVTSFVNETLSKELVGILGVVTLLSSFAHQQLRPDIKRSLAARRIVSLNELLRDAEITAAGIAADPEEQNYKILPIAREYMVQLHAIQRDELGCLPQR